MKTQMLLAASLTVLLAACAQTPPPAPVQAADVTGATAAPTALTVPVVEPADPGLATAQRNLKALGYAAGKTGDLADPALTRAILAFEKDQGLPEDGHLTPAVSEKLRLARATLQKPMAIEAQRAGLFVYGDGSARREALGFLSAPDGLVADAPAALPRPGAQASYSLGHRARDGHFTAVLAVTCHAGRMTQTNMALGLLDVMSIDCRGEGATPMQWRAAYSPKLGVVTRLEEGTGSRELIAIRPVTSQWPSAARTGLDWALSHALDTPASTPVPWSSTAVTQHFDIVAGPKMAGRDAGLGGRYAALSCRRFNLTQSGALQYPGIACQVGASWEIPGSKTPLARPASQSLARQDP